MLLDRKRISTAELLALPALLLLSVGFNSIVNFCTDDLRFELVMQFASRTDELGIHDQVPDWLFERILDVSDRPIDYALTGFVALVLSFMRRPARYVGLILLVTLPMSCFYSEIANRHMDRWLELPFAVVLVLLYMFRCRWSPRFPSQRLAWVSLTIYGIVGLSGVYLLQQNRSVKQNNEMHTSGSLEFQQNRKWHVAAV